MAAYAETTTLVLDRAERISRNLALLVGKCDITNYNTTGAEITDITKYFKTILRVICDGMSDNGYAVRWNTTDKCFHAFYPVTAHLHTITLSGTHAGNAVELSANANDAALGEAGGTGYTGITGIQNCTAAAGGEVANDVDVGEVNFLAVGLMA
jgi:hypothetical protein